MEDVEVAIGNKKGGKKRGKQKKYERNREGKVREKGE